MFRALILAAWRVNRPFPLTIAALLVLLIVGYWGVFHVVAPETEALERIYIERQARARQQGQEQKRDDTPAARFRKNQEDLQTFRQAIPPVSAFTDLIRELFEVAERSDMVIEKVSYDPKPLKDTDLLRYELSFSVSGEYSQIKKFIFALEQSERIVIIDEMALSGAENAGGRVVRLRIRISTYFKTGTV